MNRDYLLETASKLKAPSAKSLEEFASKQEKISIEMNEVFCARPDLDKMIGEKNLEMMKDNHRNHCRFMYSIFENYNSEVFVDTILWVFRTYRQHGFQLSYWPAQLDTWLELYKTHLSKPTYSEIEPFYTYILVNQAVLTKISDAIIEPNASAH
jgi:hypothetical protein